MNRIIKVALAQIQSGINKQENFKKIHTAINQAAEKNVDILVFPEATLVSFDADIRKEAETLNGNFATILKEAAVQHDMLIVAGSFEPAPSGKTYNTLIITGKGIDSYYRKVHLYDAFGARESDTIEAGNQYITLDTPFGKIGFATCYDLRFSDQFTQLGKNGAKIIIASAAWGDGPNKADHWDLLVRARAADSQSWLLACDQAWQKPTGTSPLGIGRSAVVDPTGFIHAQLSSTPDLLVTEIDLDLVEQVRERVPILK